MSQNTGEKDNFCRQKAAPPGSSLYYSILYQQPDVKHLLYILHAFHNALTEVISDCSDPGVAHMKFAWWQEELQRLADGIPRHPITQAMAEIPLTGDTITTLGKLVTHYDSHINLRQPNDYRELINFLRQGPGLFWQLQGNILGSCQPDTPLILSGFGALFGYFHVLQEHRGHSQQQRIYLPQDETKIQTDNRSLFNLQYARLENELMEHLKEFPSPDRKRHRHTLVLAQITASTCRETCRAEIDPATQRVSLTPLRKLWIAWLGKWIYR